MWVFANINKKIEEKITQENKDLRGSALGLRPQAMSRKFHYENKITNVTNTLIEPKPQIHPKNSHSLSLQESRLR